MFQLRHYNNLVRMGAIISALKNNILLSNPRTSLYVTSPNLRSVFFTESCSIVVKSKQHVLFDPRQNKSFSPPSTPVVGVGCTCETVSSHMLVK